MGWASNEDQRNHVRVYRKFGPASSFLCLECEERAAEWAFLWKTHTDPADPESYYPMCRKCHRGYDYDAWVAKIRRHKLRPYSPEEHARLSEQMRKQWRDPEYRAKMAARPPSPRRPRPPRTSFAAVKRAADAGNRREAIRLLDEYIKSKKAA